MIINDKGRQIIMESEGLRLNSYLCPRGRPTIGWGHTGTEVKLGQTITRHQAEIILEHDLQKFETAVSQMAPKAGPNQFSALVSFAFNEGIGALRSSSLLRKFLAGGPLAAANEFSKWTTAGGNVEPGLVKRRAAERALFLEVPS